MTYLILNVLTISFPLVRSFEHRINMVSKWKAMLPSILFVGAVFIVWDVAFTKMGVWGFTDEHLMGWRIFGLPIEEWLFFLTVPYACMFIYEVLKYFVKSNPLSRIARSVFGAMAIVLLVTGLLNLDLWYTSVTFIITGIWLLWLVWQSPKWLGHFLLSYLIALIPFILINGVLTGYGLENPVVWYNDSENLGIRFITIPIEDSIYALLLLSMNAFFYERLAVKLKTKVLQPVSN